MTLVLRYAARSDRGLIRGNNQDSVYAGPRLLAVADGMGGHAAGDVASKVVIAALEHLDDDTPSGDLLQSLRSAVFEGSEHLREVIRESPQLEGMGTTLTAILFAGGRLGLCHVGDSRAYLVRDGVMSHPQRSLLLRALNGQEVEPDLSMREVRVGDRYMLCSDGLSGVVSEETIAEALKDPDPEGTADRLVELALRSGGPDNVTVIVADVIEDTGGRGRLDPVVDGAAGGYVGQRQVDASSAAGRAALADPPAAPPPSPTPPTGGGPSARRRPLRPLLVAVAVLVVLVAGAVGTYVWALGHWFVGVDGSGDSEQVAVFRGLNVSVVGFDFYELDDDTTLAVADLTPAARSRVRSGITATGAQDADRILAALRDQRLPLCRTTPAAPSSGTGAASSTPPLPSAPTGAPAPTAGPTTVGVSPSTTSARTTDSSSEPGVNCREPD
jgi:protein phosphatase